jgi:hypothetical protein
MRLARLLAAAGLVLLSSSIGTVRARAADPVLPMHFGLGRLPLTRTLTVTLPPKGDATVIENPSVRLVQDLNNAKRQGQFPASQVTLSATAIGGALVQVTAVATPTDPEDVPAGRYEGGIIVAADGFGTLPVSLVITLTDRAHGWHATRVWAVLVVGAAFGTYAKWLNDTGLVLYPLRRRLQLIDSRLADVIEALPVDYKASRKAAQNAITQGDVATAKAEVARLVRYLDPARALAGATKKLRDESAAHAELARERGLDKYKTVTRILATEGATIGAHERASYDRFKDEVEAANADEPNLALVGDVLEFYQPRTSQPKLRDVLNLLRRGKYLDARKMWEEEIDKTVPDGWGDQAAPTSTAERNETEQCEPKAKKETGEKTSASGRKYGSKIRTFVRATPGAVATWSIDHVRFEASLVLIALTATVGFTQKFLGDPSFDGGEGQYFGLFFFAAAVPLGGIQVVQLLGRVFPSPTMGAPSPPAPTGDDAAEKQAEDESL